MDTMWHPALDRDKPKYRALFDELARGIDDGTLPEGAKLPPIRELAHQLDLTPATVVRAYQIGIERELLEAKTGSGTFVRTKITQPVVNNDPFLLRENSDGGEITLINTVGLFEVGQTQRVNEIIIKHAQNNGFSVKKHSIRANRMIVQQSMANWLVNWGLNIDPENIVLSMGAGFGLMVALNHLKLGKNNRSLNLATDPHSYLGFRDMVALGHVKLHAVEWDAGGMMPDALARLCESGEIDAVLTSSIIQNPYSVTLSPERMRALADIAARYDIQIIDDVVHGFLQTNQPVSGFYAYAPERCWLLFSLSKLGLSALQSGYIIPPNGYADATRQVIEQMNIWASQIQLPIINELISSGALDDIATKQRAEITERQAIVRDELNGLSIQMAEGSPFLWLGAQDHVVPSDYLASLKNRKVNILASDVFESERLPVNAFRVTLGSGLPQSHLRHALGIIRDAMRPTFSESIS